LFLPLALLCIPSSIMFADTFKTTKDFFKKSFSYDKTVEVKSTAQNGVTFTADGGIAASGSGFGNLKAEKKGADFSVDKASIGSSGKIAGDFSLANVFSGFKATFKCEEASRAGAGISAKLGLSGKQDIGGADCGIAVETDAVANKGDFSALMSSNGMQVGGKVAFGFKDDVAITDYSAVAAYSAGGATYGVEATDKLSKGTVYVANTVNPDFTVNAKAGFSLSGENNVSVTMGGKYKWDASTTLAGSIDDAAKVQLAYTTKLSDSATLNMYSQVNAMDVSSDDHKFGAKLQLRA